MSTEPESTPINYYKLLGVAYTASSREITRAYREAMKRTHPDTVAPDLRGRAEEHAKLLNLAMRTLTKPTERQKYDSTLRNEMLQDQIMSQYFGGMGMPGGQDDRYGEALRREQTEHEKAERRLTRSLCHSQCVADLRWGYCFGRLLVSCLGRGFCPGSRADLARSRASRLSSLESMFVFRIDQPIDSSEPSIAPAPDRAISAY